MDKPMWIMAGRRLGALGRVSNWLIGDWVREGVARWGERYAEAAKITGFDPHSLRNMAYVASRFDVSLRRDNLTWSHHALIAALEREEQIYWLDRATALKWSVSDLRTMMRSQVRDVARTASAQAAGPVGADAGVVDRREPAAGCIGSDGRAVACATRRVVRCPRCGEDLQLSSDLVTSAGSPRELG
jgi:hypothetical protein